MACTPCLNTSSCRCNFCRYAKPPSEKGYPTNMSVRNCEFPKYYDCYNKNVFRTGIEPDPKKGFHILNPQLIPSMYAKDFVPVDCPEGSGCGAGFASTDPRLVSAAHSGQVLTLDRPPIDASMRLSKIDTDPKLNGYGQCYKNYSDVDAGQVTYYVNKEREDPFYPPVFSTPAYTVGEMYQDPMGALKPQYNRYTGIPQGPCNDQECYDGCLSWIQDSSGHREDIISKQMRKRNEQRYAPRWYGYTPGQPGKC